MRHIAVCGVLLAWSMLGLAQSPQIKSGSTVYIEPIGGYETYLAAALTKRHVPLVVVTDKDKAEFIIKSTMNHTVPEQSSPDVVVDNSTTIQTTNSTGSTGSFNQGYAIGAERARERRAAKAALGYSDVSIAMIDPQTKQVAFAFSSTKDGSKQTQNTADDCAKHLKEFIEKSEKAKK